MCPARTKNWMQLEVWLFRAQVSARSGRLLWPPGGAIIGQWEKGAMSSLTFHSNACMICAFCQKKEKEKRILASQSEKGGISSSTY